MVLKAVIEDRFEGGSVVRRHGLEEMEGRLASGLAVDGLLDIGEILDAFVDQRVQEHDER